MHHLRSLVLGIGVATVLAWSAACGDTTTPANLAGRYSLHSVDNQAPPVTVPLSGVAWEFRSGHWDLTANATFAGELVIGIPLLSTTDTMRFGGSYTLSGAGLTLTGSGTFRGETVYLPSQLTIAGDDLIAQLDLGLGVTTTLVFRRA